MTQFAPTDAPVSSGDQPRSSSARPRPDPARRPQPFAGLGELLRLIVRLDRVRLALWFVGIVGTIVASTQSVVGLYDTEADLASYGDLVRDNSALIVQAGPGYGLDAPTLGAVLMNELAIWAIIAVGLMSLFLVVRHTRTEEETERAELLRSGPVGRHTLLAASVAYLAFANLLVAVGAAASLAAFGLPIVGSLAFGSTLFCSGIVVGAAGLVTAQIATGARAALGLGGIVIALSFVLRAVGDVGDGRLSWLSSIGWAQAIRAFADERWWVLALQLAVAAALILLAVALQARRDFGAGMLPQRLGRPAAARSLDSPLALAARLQRGAVIGWSIGLGLVGFFYGIIADQAESIIEDNPDMEDFFAQIGGASITDAFLSTSILVLAVIASGFTISSVLRLQREETATHADTVLATPTSRLSWARSHLVAAFGGTIVVLSAIGAGIGVGFASMTGDAGQILRLWGAALAMVPALAVIAALTMALYGSLPKLAIGAWGILAFVFVVAMLGQPLDLPQWAMNISPLEHAPALPAESFDVVPIVALLAIAAALTAIGLASLNRRDIN